ELGFRPLSPAEAAAELSKAKAAVLVGDRIAELVGAPALRALPPALRLVVFDVAELDVPALDALLGLPTHVERTGTWINVDGHAGPIAAAKAPPKGVRALERLLESLSKLAAAGRTS